MHPNPRRIAPVLLVVVVVAALWWWIDRRNAEAENQTLAASGTIEAVEVRVSSELGGKVNQVCCAEGSAVIAGDLLIQIDTSLLEAQRAQAQAALGVAEANAKAAGQSVIAAEAQAEAAQAMVDAAFSAQEAALANLDLLKAGAPAEQILAAEAGLAQAEANLQSATAGFNALTAGSRPEDIAAAQEKLSQARQAYYSLTVTLNDSQSEDVLAALATAQTNLDQAKTSQDELAGITGLPASALEAAAFAIPEAENNLAAAQLAYDAVQDPALPYYRQIEALQFSLDLAGLNLSQAEARQSILQAVQAMPQAALDAAQAGVEDAQKMVEDAETAYEALAAGEQASVLESAWDEVQRAQAALSALGRAPGGVEVSLNQVDAAAALRDAASASLLGLESGARAEQIRAAQAQVDSAQAQIEVAQANLTVSQARAESAQYQTEAAQAQVEAAQAALDAIDVQIAKLSLHAPVGGAILSRAIQPGEVAAPGAVLLVIGQLDELSITVYVPEDRYGAITLGQSAQVSVDSYPGEIFDAQVMQIADQAEFTPRNVQTAEGRKSTVFAVKLNILGDEDRLKPGMPADVIFSEK
jgi:multidrug resistance efflux pump